MLKVAVYGVALAGVGVTLGFMLHAGEPERASWWPGMLPFAAWASAPFLATGYAAYRLSSRYSLCVLLFAGTLLAVTSVVLFYRVFVSQPDAQSGLVFVFLPLWQLIGLVPFLLGAAALRDRGSTADHGVAAGRPRREPTDPL